MSQKISKDYRIKDVMKSRFGSLFVFGLLFLIISFLTRTVFLFSYFHSINKGFLQIINIYLIGTAFDFAVYIIGILPIILYLMFISDKQLKNKSSRITSVVLYWIGLYLLLFSASAEWFFFEEFECRFNFIAVDYLIYTHEVVANISESYPIIPIFTSIALISTIVVLLTHKYTRIAPNKETRFGERIKAGLIYAVLLLVSFGFVKFFPKDISSNHYNNELAKNGLESLVEAFFINELNFNDFYVTEDTKKVFTNLRANLASADSSFDSNDEFSIERKITSQKVPVNKNIILIVVESLSADYLTKFGNKAKITPNLDRLADESLFFTNLYATGTRTTRGLEAIALSLPPTPGCSIVKRPENSNLFTIGQIFQKQGYQTKFIYGGFGYFDNMNAFFHNNGFDIVDRADMDKTEITFSNAWGVCDEDLFNKVIKESDKSFNDKKTFFSFVLTTSNHRPYTYPQKIDIPSGHGRNGAVKYTDYAIGDFFEKTKSKPWFKDTIFIIVADHCASSAGKIEVPVEKYHIPLFIYSPGFIQPQKYDKLCSQMDLSPTLLGLINFSYKSKFFGENVLVEPHQRALLGTYQILGLFEDNTLTLLSPGRKIKTYIVDANDQEKPADIDKSFISETISYYQAAQYLLNNHLQNAF